ncbi:hypothetical protein D5272_02010 [bacterium D16-76]|nr:hypothetical protein [bacterium D16-76]
MKNIFFVEDYTSLPIGFPLCITWIDTDVLVKKGVENIVTTQMGYLNTSLFEKGYRIFICPSEKECYEIKLGLNERTGREIRMSHNLFNLWKAGEFSTNH